MSSVDDAVNDILVTFEQPTYNVIEGQQNVEVCAVTSATPASDQTVLAFVSTEDGTAIGMTIWTEGGVYMQQ